MNSDYENEQISEIYSFRRTLEQCMLAMRAVYFPTISSVQLVTLAK